MATLRTAGNVDPHPLLHPLSDAFGRCHRWVGHVSHGLPTLPQGPGFASIGQHPIMANSDEARWQKMEQEALNKDVSGQLQGLELMTFFSIVIGQTDPSISHLDDAVVGDGHAMRVASEIVDDLLGSAKGGLGIDDPVFAIELIDQLGEATVRAQVGGMLVEEQAAMATGLLQDLEKLAAEDLSQRLNREEKLRVGGRPACSVIGKGTSRDESMQMKMWLQDLIPGMEDYNSTELAPQVAATKLKQRFTGAAKQ